MPVYPGALTSPSLIKMAGWDFEEIPMSKLVLDIEVHARRLSIEFSRLKTTLFRCF
jgi:hypothetical protein